MFAFVNKRNYIRRVLWVKFDATWGNPTTNK